MKILLSPAKLMSIEPVSQWHKHTQPEYIELSKKLHSVLKEYTPKELENLLDISPKLSQESWERNQEWKPNPSKKESLQAIYAFKGEVYRGLNAKNLPSTALNYLQKNLLIISGLYGILRPSDDIMPYRLEIGKKLKTEKSKDLYSFWEQTLTHYLNSHLENDEPILNLCSKEYFKVFKTKNLKGKVVNVEFKDFKDNKWKYIVIYIKNARGKMARWCAINNIKDVEKLKVYNEDGYEFSEELSQNNNLVFVR